MQDLQVKAKFSQHDIKLINIQKTGENKHDVEQNDILLHIRSGCVP